MGAQRQRATRSVASWGWRFDAAARIGPLQFMVKKLPFDSERYLELVKRYDSIVRLLDQTIYDLCAAHPDHKSAASVHAKVWIIARTLSSGLERAIKSEPTG